MFRHLIFVITAWGKYYLFLPQNTQNTKTFISNIKTTSQSVSQSPIHLADILRGRVNWTCAIKSAAEEVYCPV